MFVVVGLGNPGAEYDGTRHNIGFEVVDRLAVRHRFEAGRRWKSSEVRRGKIGDHEVLLVKPLTYMNLSGDAVGAVLRYYKAEPGQLIVVHDELDFAEGLVRLKMGGGHGGHNGIRSVVSHVGRDFVRVRIGIGKPARADRGADHVLSRFDSHGRAIMDGALEQAVEAVEAVLSEGVAAAMNRVNRRGADPGA